MVLDNIRHLVKRANQPNRLPLTPARNYRPHAARLVGLDEDLPSLFSEAEGAVIHSSSQRAGVIRREPRRENPFPPALEMRRHRPVSGRLQQLEFALARLNNGSLSVENAKLVFPHLLRPQDLGKRIRGHHAIADGQLHSINAQEHVGKKATAAPLRKDAAAGVRLSLTDAGQFRPADGAASLSSGPPVLQRYFLGVLDLPLRPALHAVSFHKAPFLTLRIPIPE